MKACFFDLDGTLVDTEPMWAAALRLALQETDCPLGKEATDELVYGRSWLDIHADLCRLFPERCDDRTVLEAKIGRHFSALKQAGDVALPSSLALLIQLAQRLPVAIVSGSSREMVGEWIDDLQIDPHVDFYLGCEDYPVGKPDPSCYRIAAERFAVSPGECLVFEDSSAGVKAAKAAGMHCVALRRSGARQQDLSAADLVVGDFAELDPSGLTEQPPRFTGRS